MFQSEWLDPLQGMARRAGEIELKYQAQGVDVMEKGDSSPVTLADQEGEAEIIRGLTALDADIPILAEESVAAGCIPDLSGGAFWCVDALDGTKQFIKGRGEFTVNIALLVDFQPVFGLIYVPTTDDMYFGHVEDTATRVFEGESRTIRVRKTPDAGLTVLASRSHNDNALFQGYLSDKPVAEKLFSGSSIKFCEIAAGRADIYPRFKPTCEWDIAAGQAILEAAGGQLTDVHGAPVKYAKTDCKFVNPHFIASNGNIA